MCLYTGAANAEPFLAEIARHLRDLHFDVVLIGNAAAALQGAPVTTIDFDFMFRKTAVNLRKLKTLASRLDATVMRPYYPASDMFRVVRDDDGLQLDFMASIDGIRSFAGLRDRAQTIEVGGAALLVASLSDIIKSKKAARRPRRALAAVRRESDRALVQMIRRRLALPLEKRMDFLRKRVGFRGSAL